MAEDKNIKKNLYGDEAPSLTVFLLVIIVAMVLIASAYIAYYKFHLKI